MHVHVQSHSNAGMLLASSSGPAVATTRARVTWRHDQSDTLRRPSVKVCKRVARCCESKICVTHATKRKCEHIAAAASAAAALTKCGARSIPGIVAHSAVDFYDICWPLEQLLGSGGVQKAAPKMCRSSQEAARAHLAACCSQAALLNTAAKIRGVAWWVRGGIPATTSRNGPRLCPSGWPTAPPSRRATPRNGSIPFAEGGVSVWQRKKNSARKSGRQTRPVLRPLRHGDQLLRP